MKFGNCKKIKGKVLRYKSWYPSAILFLNQIHDYEPQPQQEVVWHCEDAKWFHSQTHPTARRLPHQILP